VYVTGQGKLTLQLHVALSGIGENLRETKFYAKITPTYMRFLDESLPQNSYEIITTEVKMQMHITVTIMIQLW